MMELEKSKTLKRRLRRERMAMEKAGDFVPFTPRSEPFVTKPDDQPKLTNSAKRAARKRKKQASWQREVEDICSGTSSNPTGVLQDNTVVNSLKSKKRKKRAKSKVEDALISNNQGSKHDNVKLNTNKEHIRFGEDEDSPISNIMDTNYDCVKSSENKKHIKFDEEEDALISGDKDTGSVTNEMLRNDSELVDDVVGRPSEANKGMSGEKDTPSDVSKETKKDNPPRKKRRYVLFVGNLSYETQEADVREHFKKVGSITSVRIAKHKDSNSCKGFCHLEVGDEETYLKALSLHHTFMAKRRINVEYSSGQSEEKGDIKRKNLKLQTLNKTGRLGGSKFHQNKSVNSQIKAKPAEKVRGAFFV